MKFAAVAAFILLAGAGLFAQERHHSAPSPPPARLGPQVLSTQGRTVLPPPPPPSPFAARPNTYAPHYDRPSRLQNRHGYSYVAPYYDSAPVDSSPAAAAPEPPQPQESPRAAPPSEPAPVPEPPRVAVAHGPDTFYVIPGCYAGNRPPNPERLPKGCDLEKMRTTPIR